MNVTKEKITPKKAMEYLQRNVHNRPLSQKVVGRYAKAMLAGEWQLNGETLKQNGNGDWIDGQHRFHACVKAGVPFESYVIRGLPHEAFDTIDQGKVRQISDIFARQGHKYYSVLAAAVRNLFRYDNGWLLVREALRPDQANAVLKANPGIHQAVQKASELAQRRGGLITPGLLSFLMFATSRSDAAKSVIFWSSVINGEGLTRGMPAYTLRERLIGNTRSTAKLSQDHICAICIKAWNTFKTGGKREILRWNDDEAFPTIQ